MTLVRFKLFGCIIDMWCINDRWITVFPVRASLVCVGPRAPDADVVAGALVAHAVAICVIEVEAGLVDLLTNGGSLWRRRGQAVGKAFLEGKI
jgi:hypothetical protein